MHRKMNGHMNILRSISSRYHVVLVIIKDAMMSKNRKNFIDNQRKKILET